MNIWDYYALRAHIWGQCAFARRVPSIQVSYTFLVSVRSNTTSPAHSSVSDNVITTPIGEATQKCELRRI